MNHLKILIMAALPLLVGACGNSKKTAQPEPTATPTTVAFVADSAYKFVKEQCQWGARTPESEAWRKCGDYIAQKFRAYGLSVVEQNTTVTGWDSRRFACRNIIAAYKPDVAERVIICSHWDSRPWADTDPDSSKHRQPVMAANDGASGVAVMMEVARLLGQLKPKVGIDFICFDAEDYGAPYWADNAATVQDDWCLGSQHWARNPHKEGYTARYGVLLDMVGGRDAKFRYEGFSMKYAEQVVARLWSAAETAGYSNYFMRQDGGWITDDHVPMNEIAGIPTIDVIAYYDSEPSFGPTWHTTHDTPENIDPQTLKAVGQALLQLLSEEE